MKHLRLFSNSVSPRTRTTTRTTTTTTRRTTRRRTRRRTTPSSLRATFATRDAAKNLNMKFRFDQSHGLAMTDKIDEN